MTKCLDNGEDLTKNLGNFQSIWWYVGGFSPTPLKNMFVKSGPTNPQGLG